MAGSDLDYKVLSKRARDLRRFGYDAITLCKLLIDAGFTVAEESSYQRSLCPELRIDDNGYNAGTTNQEDEHFSLFVEARK